MNLSSRVALMALGPLAGAVCRAAGAGALSDGAAAAGRALAERFTDHSSRAAEALAAASERAWAALERALAGQGVLTLADRADDKAFRAEVRAFVAAVTADPDFAARCLLELRAARAAGVLGGDPDAGAVGERLGALARFGDPAAVVREQWALADELAADLRGRGFATLAAFLTLRPPGGGDPLLAVAVRYYLRRAVEGDPRLFQGLTFSQLEVIGRAQEVTHSSLAGVAARLEALHDTIRDQELPLAEEIAEPPSVGERFREHTNGVLAVSPDGSRVLGGSKYDGKLRLFDAGSGKELRRLPGHAGWVTAVAFAPDGCRALSAGEDGAAKLWDVGTGKLLRTWPPRGAGPFAVGFTADGRPRVR